MSKFKVGDKVKVLEVTNRNMDHLINNIYKIADISPALDGVVYLIHENGMEYAFIEKRLELVNEGKTMKKYDMDKWLKDNGRYINDSYNNTILYKQITTALSSDIEHYFYLFNFNTSIIQWIDYVNTLGANLSYPEEIKEPKFNLAKRLKKNGFKNRGNGLYIHQESDYVININILEHTEENANLIIQAAELSAKIKKVI